MTPTDLIGYDWLGELRLWAKTNGEETRRWAISATTHEREFVRCDLNEKYGGQQWAVTQVFRSVEEAVYCALREWAYADTATRAASRTVG